MQLYISVEELHTPTLWGDRGDQNRFIGKELYVRDASLQPCWLLNWVWLRLEIKQNHQAIWKKKCQFRADVPTHGYRPRYTADNDPAETDMCAQQCWLLPDGCCCLNNTGNKILFRINWPRVNQGLNVAPCEEVHWCDVRWPGRQGHWPASFNPAIVVSGGEMLILKRMLFPLSLRHQELDIF